MKKILVIAIVSLVILAGTAYWLSANKKADPKVKITDRKQVNMAHQMPVNLEKEMIADLKKDVKVIENTTTDTGRLSEALEAKALTDTKKTIEEKLKNNIATKRNFKDTKFVVSNYTKDVASVLFEFTDKSYAYDVKTNKELSKPTNKKVKLALSVKKIGKRWKITGIFSSGAKVKQTKK